MQRYFISNRSISNGKIKVNEDDFFHMHKVMRMKNHEQVTCVDEDEHVYLCELTDAGCPELTIIQELEEHHELDVYVRLIYGLPKLDKFEYVIQKCTELGVSEIVPFLSNRSLIKADENRFIKKLQRYEKIVKEACEQSQRQRLVKIHPPMHLKEVLQLSANHQLVAYEEASRAGECQNFERCLRLLKPGEILNIVVGPEGGFDRDEIAQLQLHGYSACSLGSRILRSETAPVYMMSVIGFYRELKEEL